MEVIRTGRSLFAKEVRVKASAGSTPVTSATGMVHRLTAQRVRERTAMEGTAQGAQLVLKTSVGASLGVRVLCLPPSPTDTRRGSQVRLVECQRVSARLTPFQCSVTDTRSAVNREKGVRFLPLELHALVTEGIGAGLQTQSWEFESPPVLHAVVAQLGRASPCQGEGRRFEPGLLLHTSVAQQEEREASTL
jgi:hypothetical protein